MSDPCPTATTLVAAVRSHRMPKGRACRAERPHLAVSLGSSHNGFAAKCTEGLARGAGLRPQGSPLPSVPAAGVLRPLPRVLLPGVTRGKFAGPFPPPPDSGACHEPAPPGELFRRARTLQPCPRGSVGPQRWSRSMPASGRTREAAAHRRASHDPCALLEYAPRASGRATASGRYRWATSRSCASHRRRTISPWLLDRPRVPATPGRRIRPWAASGRSAQHRWPRSARRHRGHRAGPV